MNTKTFSYIGLAAALAVAPTGGHAALSYLDTSIDGEGVLVFGTPIGVINGWTSDADSKTAAFLDLNTALNATSVYTAPGGTTLQNGDILSFTDTGSATVNVLNDGAGDLAQSTSSLEGFGTTTWNLEISYSISGIAQASIGADIDTTLLANGATFAAGEGLLPAFQSGTIDIFYNEVSGFSPLAGVIDDGQQVLQLILTPGAVLGATNLELFGTVDFSWFDADMDGAADAGLLLTAAEEAAIKNLFNFVSPVGGKNSYYDIWLDGVTSLPPVANVFWDLNTNVEPNLIPLAGGNTGSLANPGCAAGKLCRTTNLNLDVEFSPVPEPSSVALLGLGLLGLGASVRRKRQA
tara:strand:- start:3008 stop:4057 length:1050 start_codon:yes stop_codon:yes gene_type:complete